MFEGSGKWKWIFAILIVGNILGYIYRNWGLVTVKVTDEPLGKVISSIEWQSWMKIYTNLPLDSKVSMYVDHVPLAEAMETLSANVDVPPPADGDDSNRQRRNLFGGQGTNGAPLANGGAPPSRPPGGGGGGGGAFGRVAQWNLAFFVAPSSSQVESEIRAFQSGDPGSNSTIYAFGTQMQIVSTDGSSTADPRAQSWPGFKPEVQVPPPVDPTQNPGAAFGQGTGSAPATPSAPLSNWATYLQAFAASSNVWIMAPGDWTPDVASPPVANSSIISAIKDFVSGAHGSVTEALVLRSGRNGARGDFIGNDPGWEDRMRNAIDGLPADEKPAALDELKQEVDWRDKLKAMPADQRRQFMMQHFLEKMIYGERLTRLSPAKRAQMYQRMVTARAASRAQ